MLAVFGRIDPHRRRSITFDNDTAFAEWPAQDYARHDDLVLRRYASWQKGGIENANGRLRAAARSRYRPHIRPGHRGDRPTTNLTPRKCLGFKTPFQAMLAELGKDVQIRFS